MLRAGPDDGPRDGGHGHAVQQARVVQLQENYDPVDSLYKSKVQIKVVPDFPKPNRISGGSVLTLQCYCLLLQY